MTHQVIDLLNGVSASDPKDTLKTVAKVFKALTSAAYHADRCEGDEVDVVTGLLDDAQNLVGILEDKIYDSITDATRSDESLSILHEVMANMLRDLNMHLYILKDVEVSELDAWARALAIKTSISQIDNGKTTVIVPAAMALNFKLRWHSKCIG